MEEKEGSSQFAAGVVWQELLFHLWDHFAAEVHDRVAFLLYEKEDYPAGRTEIHGQLAASILEKARKAFVNPQLPGTPSTPLQHSQGLRRKYAWFYIELLIEVYALAYREWVKAGRPTDSWLCISTTTFWYSAVTEVKKTVTARFERTFDWLERQVLCANPAI